MEDEMMEKARELKRAIMESEEYEKFEFYRKQLLENEELYQAACEFREKNFKYQLTGQLEGARSIEELLERYTPIMEQPIVYAYMNAELVFCKKLQGIYDLLSEDLELDIDFL